jgi:putative tryptophan/tyrosine transport system substrate-binding protein
MKKISLIIGLIGLAIGAFFIIDYVQKPSDSQSLYTIGILQTASHPALDAVQDGFIKILDEKFGSDIKYTIQNAQGSITQAHAIAQQFQANKKYTAFFAIGTPAAQALGSLEKTRPVVIAAVTDPEALGLANQAHITGVNDMIDVKEQINMLIALLPQAKNIGIIYTSGEINSEVMAKKMREELASHGISSHDFAISNEADIPAMIELACRKSDALLAPTDNTIASSIHLIATQALSYKKPLIVSDNMLVQFGPLASRGIDYTAHGQQAGAILYELLAEYKRPFDLPIQETQTDKVFINEQTLTMLGLSIPDSLEKSTVLIDARKNA